MRHYGNPRSYPLPAPSLPFDWKTQDSGVVPGCSKKALVIPLLKKPSLGANCLKNYRLCPIYPSFRNRQSEWLQPDWMKICRSSSYLSLCSRRTRPWQLRDSPHLGAKQYPAWHGPGNVGILLLLDMSTAFETVDHITLLDRLHTELGIVGGGEGTIGGEHSWLMRVALRSPPRIRPRSTAIHCVHITTRQDYPCAWFGIPPVRGWLPTACVCEACPSQRGWGHW